MSLADLLSLKICYTVAYCGLVSLGVDNNVGQIHTNFPARCSALRDITGGGGRGAFIHTLFPGIRFPDRSAHNLDSKDLMTIERERAEYYFVRRVGDNDLLLLYPSRVVVIVYCIDRRG